MKSGQAIFIGEGGEVYQPKFQYPLEEFVEHSEFFLSLGAKAPGIVQMQRYFASKYPASGKCEENWGDVSEEGRFKRDRLIMAFLCVAMHREQFQEFITGSEENCAGFSFALIAALWAVFSGAPDGCFPADPPEEVLDQIKSLARECNSHPRGRANNCAV